MADTGDSPSSITLPKGGGALNGIGEKFSPDLYTGTGNFTVPISIPAGRNGFQPQLQLVYSTGHGNSDFGLGWKLDLPGITRKTSHGVPQYNEAAEAEDGFILSGAEDLVRLPSRRGDPSNARRYRPRTEGLFADIQRRLDDNNDYWEVKTKDGLVTVYGRPELKGRDDSTVLKPGTSKSAIWNITQTRDPFGNVISYQYGRDAGEIPSPVPNLKQHQWSQPILQRIQYINYGDPSREKFLVSVDFSYEDRPDSWSDYRSGFEIRTTKRCSSIRVTSHAEQDRPIREYRFSYKNDALNGVSQLAGIVLIGFDDSATPVQELPPLDFGYTQFEPQSRRFKSITGTDLPALSLTDPSMQLVDLHGAGLPDLLQMNGSVRYWRNLGNNKFDLPRTMAAAPPHSLADSGVQLVDANGDGRHDLLVTTPTISGFYPLKFDSLTPTWDANSFQRFRNAPSFSLEDPEVELLDITGDGIADALRSGSRFEAFLNHDEIQRAWEKQVAIERRAVETFPNVNFSDPRVKFADMTGDGLTDIALIYDRNVEYWPNLGNGNWGTRIHMRSGPQLPFNFDPERLLLGDVDGDGVADLVYVEDGSVHLWINRCGNGWSQEVVIQGTPRMNNLITAKLVDLNGTGTAGILWSSEANLNGRPHLYFLDLTGAVKPYLLNSTNNHMGAVTRIEYASSSKFYLDDLANPNMRWKTPLPFPVQLVFRIESIDDISGGKLTTEYRYHHGYWDGAEREFNGFGLVEQFDTETFEAYNSPGLDQSLESFIRVEEKNYSPPTLLKTWFHQGAVGHEYGDWSELNLNHEYWMGDPELLRHSGSTNDFLETIAHDASGTPAGGSALRLARRAKRDALRSLRGSILRTELYALDGDERQANPYTISEYSYGLREIDPPEMAVPNSRRIFFPFRKSQRVTQWERGQDPLTVFIFTDDYNAFGLPQQQTTVAPPRFGANRARLNVAIDRVASPDEDRILATHLRTKYATPDAGTYIHDRICETKSFELTAAPFLPDTDITSLPRLLQRQFERASAIHRQFQQLLTAEVELVNHTLNYFDGAAFVGLPHGRAGTHGALCRSEQLVFRDKELNAAFADGAGSRRPGYLGGSAIVPDGSPANFGSATGYRRTSADGLHEDGYYADVSAAAFDFQIPDSAAQRGLVLRRRDALGHETTIAPDVYWLLSASVTNAVGITTSAVYNYRVFQPATLTDPNDNVTEFKFSPAGLLVETWTKGKSTSGEGDGNHPSLHLQYNFLAYHQTENRPRDKRVPIFVHATRRVWHDTDANAPASELHDTFESREYSDGFGRLIQSRSQADPWAFGDDAESAGLPATYNTAPQAIKAVRVDDRTIVSGWQRFDNKGRVIEKFEPFFSRGWEFEREREAKRGVFAVMFYDARGQLTRTVNPDGSEQRVVLGQLTDLSKPDQFEPSPWVSHTYDGNDLVALSSLNNPGGAVPQVHQFTPTTIFRDALGRAIAQVQRNGPDSRRHWFLTSWSYDLRGNLLKITDPLGRVTISYSYDLLQRPLRVQSLDAGLRTSVPNAAGNLIEQRDSKGAVILREFDSLNRLTSVWARDDSGQALTCRERVLYGDGGSFAAARSRNDLGRKVEHYDEAGVISFTYDFKGNVVDKTRELISDAALERGWTVDWSAANARDALDISKYKISTTYDALNRATTITYPADVNNHRAVLNGKFDRAGVLQKITVDGEVYVERIAYNAKQQRLFIVYGNNVLTRYAYEPETFRLARMRTEFLVSPSPASRSAAFATANDMTLQPGGEVLQDTVYAHDLVGNIVSTDERVRDCGIANTANGRDRLIRSFSYDPLYRLTEATGRECVNFSMPRPFTDDPACGFYAPGNPTHTQRNGPDVTVAYEETYSYDPAGNALDLRHQTGTNVWRRRFGMGDSRPEDWANAATNRLTTVINGSDQHSYVFDGCGNLTRQDNDKQQAWDHADRLILFTVQSSSSATASIASRYLYGADGTRVKKWVRKNGGFSASAVYVDSGFEHHTWSENGTTKSNNHLHVLEKHRVAIIRVGEKHSNDGGERIQYHLGDHLGSSSIVVGGDAATDAIFTNREEYSPYGEATFGGVQKKRYRFSGKERDEESGLYYFGARYYAPWFLRWVTCDPMGIIDGVNTYLYAHLSPLRFRDEVGFQADDVTIKKLLSGAEEALREIDTRIEAQQAIVDLMEQDKSLPALQADLEAQKEGVIEAEKQLARETAEGTKESRASALEDLKAREKTVEGLREQIAGRQADRRHLEELKEKRGTILEEKGKLQRVQKGESWRRVFGSEPAARAPVVLNTLGTIMVAKEGAEGVINTVEAPLEKKGEVGFGAIGGLVGGYVGGEVGAAAAGAIIVAGGLTGGAAIGVAVVVIGAGAVIGGATGKVGGTAGGRAFDEALHGPSADETEQAPVPLIYDRPPSGIFRGSF